MGVVELKKLKRSRLYSEELGINLSTKEESEVFKWFLASVLFGATISEKVAKNTYKTFEKYGILTPQEILDAGWDALVNVLDEGGYVRYDFSTADKLLSICRTLLEKYGCLTKLHEKAENPRDLEEKLLEFKGVGPVTVNIFLRELRPFWEKADPKVLPRVEKRAQQLGVKLEEYGRKSLTFTRLEAGLIRGRRE